MAYICSNCDKLYDSGKYCSEKCEREAGKFWRQFSLALVVGLLAAIFANYSSPIADVFSASGQFISEAGLPQLAAEDSCAAGIGKIKSMAKPALPEKFFAWAPASKAVDLAQKLGSCVGLAEASEN